MKSVCLNEVGAQKQRTQSREYRRKEFNVGKKIFERTGSLERKGEEHGKLERWRRGDKTEEEIQYGEAKKKQIENL